MSRLYLGGVWGVDGCGGLYWGMDAVKDDAIKLIEQLPDGTSLETMIAELHFKLRVLRAMERADRGEVVTHEEAKERLGR